MRTALVTGACGLLGQHLVRRLESEYKVLAVDIAPNVFEEKSNIIYMQCDLTEHTAARQLLSESTPEVIYNCAAYNDVDGCENNREMAYSVNVALVENLVKTGAERIVHFSSDYVFNGKNGPYSENDQTDPVGYYGETKLQSERIILDAKGKHLVIRTNVLFGEGINVRQNFVSWLMANFKQGKRLRIVSDQYNNPVHADNLAEASIEAENRGLSGILHIGGGSYLSRCDIAYRVVERFGFERDLIIPVLTTELGQVARRPMRGGLIIEKAEKLLNVPLLTFKEALRYKKI